MKTSIVLGLQFGDEGKGSTTSYLVSKSKNPLVIRFSGGHQAGHTVIHEGNRHVFSSFGSGTLQGAPTFLSRYCTFYPTSVLNEYKRLKHIGVSNPVLYVDALAPVTTPFDHYANQTQAKATQHGSVGVGFGTTIKRHESYYKLYFQDLFNRTVLKAKMQNILAYYQNIERVEFPEDINDKLDKWYHAIEELINLDVISMNRASFYADNETGETFDHFIFEGSQGILLDMDFGFFPNVTRSNTTSKNALALIKEYGLPKPDIYYVTRAYQTRHGNGFMTNEGMPLTLTNNENETNILAEYQGRFRVAPLDMDLVNYALECDNNFSYHCNSHIIITCLDQIQGEIPFTANAELKSGNALDIMPFFSKHFNSRLFSYSPEGTKFKINGATA